jgi:O-antigen/teichoic acid export membrane protein
VTSANLRTRRTALNFASGLALTGATMVVAFFATPLLLRWLGAERYGAVRAATDWFGHLTVFELGISGALPPLLALALGRGDASGLRRLMAAGIRTYVFIGALALAGGVAITLAATHLVPVGPGLAHDLRVACLVGLIGLLFYPLTPFRALADAEQKGYVISGALLAQSMLTVALALVLARAGYGITGQFAALAAGQVLLTLLLALAGARRVPGLAQDVVAPTDPDARARIARLNFPTLWFMLSGRLGLLTDNIVVAGLLGPARVVPLYLTQRLLSLAGQQLFAVGGASWAALAELHALGRRETFNARLLDLTRLVAGLAVATLIPIAAFNHHFVARWVGAASFGGDGITVLAAVNAYLLALVTLWTWVFSGTGQVRLMVGAAVAASVLNLVVSIVATKLVGLSGPLIGTLVGLAGVSLWYVPLALERTFGTDAFALARAAALPLLWGLPVGAAIAWFARVHAPAGWLELGAEMAAAGIILLGFWWVFALTAEERGSFRARVGFALKR